MLKRIDQNSTSRFEGGLDHRPEHAVEPEGTKSSFSRDLGLWLSLARRQVVIIGTAAVVGLLVGFAYIVTSVPQYTATTQLLIDSRKDNNKDNNDASTSIAELEFDTGAIDSQVEVLKSERIAQLVLSNLKLTDNPEFMTVRKTLFGRFLARLRPVFELNSWFTSLPKSASQSSLSPLRDAIAILQDNLAVRRVRRTYVLALDYTAFNPDLAANIANAFAEAYLSDQFYSGIESSERLTQWMQTRISQLKNASLNSDLAVQKFKADHHLLTADGKLVSDQQLTELTQQLMVAQSDTAKAEARFNHITDVLKSGRTDRAMTDSFDSSLLTDLQEKYLASSGSRPALAASYQRQMSDELRRIAEAYRSDSEIARAKEDALKKSMAALAGENVETNLALVQLRQLEREAESFRLSYQNFLQRYQAIFQHQSAPVSEARVITVASPPSIPSYPKRPLILGLSLVLGSMAGIGIALGRESLDRTFRTTSQVREDLRLEFLGMLQELDRPRMVEKTGNNSPEPKKVAPESFRYRYSIDWPLSPFAEALRSIKLRVDLVLEEREAKVIGFISALPGEGKTTVAKNFASCLAQLGAATLLIDGDLRRAGLTRSLARHADQGILEAIRGERTLGDLLLLEPDSGLFFLPAVITQRLHHPGEVLASLGMRSLLSQASKEFEYVIVDLPAVDPVVDVPTAASIFDAFVLIVEWGRTPRVMVQSILASHKLLYDRCLGVVFNKVQNRIALYEGRSPAAYKGYFTSSDGR
jgi:succinoglycan biosynthesis transport protein ExoP